MTEAERNAVRRTVASAISTLKGAGYAGTAEQLRGAMDVLVGDAQDSGQLEQVNTILRWYFLPNETVVEAVQRLYDEFLNRPSVSPQESSGAVDIRVVPE